MAMKDYLKRNLSKMAKEQEARLGALAKKSEVAESDLASALATKIDGKADAATTLAGYGITDAYTKSETDGLIGGAYKPAGSKQGSELTSALLVEANFRNVYNITSELAITAQNEGLFLNMTAGQKVRVGDDVGVVAVDIEEGGETVTVYKFNNFAGFVDLSGYSTTQEMNSAIATAIADKIELTDLSTANSGSGNVVTGVSYDNTTGVFTVTLGSAVMASELVDLTDQEIDALWDEEESGT